MLKTVQFVTDDGNVKRMLLFDSESGNSAKEIMSVPGVYDNVACTQDNLSIKLNKLSGGINGYKTHCFGLVVNDNVVTEDMTQLLHQALMVPVTAVSAVLATYPEDVRDDVSKAIDIIHYCENIKESDKLCIPAEAFSEMDKETADRMMSVRRSYILKNTENQEIFQKSPTDTFGVLLPPLQDIHYGDDGISALDLLRVLAPYRKQVSAGAYSYRSIYHTPYFKVDMRLRGMIPSDMSWITGYSSNDTLEIQSNEQHMMNNLNMYYCSDVSRYVAEMVSGIFFDTTIGSLISRLCIKRAEDLIYYLCDEIRGESNDQISCDLQFTDVFELYQNGWPITGVTRLIKDNLVIKEGYLKSVILNRPNDRRIVDCDNLPFVLDISDVEEQEFTDIMIKQGFISGAMQRFLIGLCRTAYAVNWGHTGATTAIPGFVVKSALEEIDKQLSTYLFDRSKSDYIEPEKYPNLFLQESSESDDDEIFSDEGREEVSSNMNYYVTSETMQKMMSNSLPYDYFSTKATAAQSSEAAVVEYWKTVNGENNLDVFLSSVLLKTADASILFESFVKLCRWGSIKPKLLVFPKHPDVRHVFDLNTGMRMDNLVITNEADLIKVNGCDYYIESALCSNSNTGLAKDRIIGFCLAKNYGMVVKRFLASWNDLGEIVASGEHIIGDFVTVSPMTLNPEEPSYIESFENISHEFYLTDKAIEEGLKLKVQPKDLSPLALMTSPSVLDSMGYLKALKNDRVITLKDRQYDILHRYIDAVNRFYSKNSKAILSVQSSIDLMVLSTAFLEVFNEDTSVKQDSNVLTAANTLSKLDLGLNDVVSIEWDTTELSGKFYLIADKELISDLPPIEFSDRQLQSIAANTHNRIILLMLSKDGKYIFCRKDLRPQEVLLVPNRNPNSKQAYSIAAKPYSELAPLIEALQAGKHPTVKGVPAVLHESLKGLF